MSYTSEYQDALRRIEANNSHVRSLRFFLRTVSLWHEVFNENLVVSASSSGPAPVVAVLGHGIPEQLIHACGTTPLHLLGGSHASCQWSDDAVPRDSDPASRSILGYTLKLAQRDDINPLFVVPVANDNMRKIAYILMREGHTVLPVDVPPAITSKSAQHAWEHALTNMVRATERHVGRRATARSIREADHLVGAARAAMVEFERVSAECTGVLDVEARLLVLGSYYQTQNVAQWTCVLKELTDEVRARYCTMGRPSTCAPRILVVGSPLLFPQQKVPMLIQNTGLCLTASVDATSTARFASLNANERRGGAQRLIGAIARKHYTLDSSGAHVVNQAMEQYVEYLLCSTEVDGVVFHILKGQIEHDFTYARMEPLFEQRNIPVFRLETDYQYMDVEQLRIRLEAFAEMLGQRTFANSRPSMRRSA